MAGGGGGGEGRGPSKLNRQIRALPEIYRLYLYSLKVQYCGFTPVLPNPSVLVLPRKNIRKYWK